MRVILYAGERTMIYDNATGIGNIDEKLTFFDSDNVKHVTTLPYEVIYD